MTERARTEEFLAALLRSIDRDRLGRELEAVLPDRGAATPSPARSVDGDGPLATKLLLTDLLDDDIVGAPSASPNYPLRVLFGTLSAKLTTDAGFAFAIALSALFRLPLGDEARLIYALETSSAFYVFCESCAIDGKARSAMAPLLATLLSSELGPLELVSVEGARTFDSSVHERAPGASPHAAAISRPASFLCRVRGTGAVRKRAWVVT